MSPGTPNAHPTETLTAHPFMLWGASPSPPTISRAIPAQHPVPCRAQASTSSTFLCLSKQKQGHCDKKHPSPPTANAATKGRNGREKKSCWRVSHLSVCVDYCLYSGHLSAEPRAAYPQWSLRHKGERLWQGLKKNKSGRDESGLGSEW